MNRSIRRHQQRVAKLRRTRILRANGLYRPLHTAGFIWHAWSGPDKPWAQLSELVRNEPGWWRHEMTIVPARINSHRLERAIELGRDPDAVIWPDARRPHPYYW